MSYKNICPPELIEPLAWLSKVNWLRLWKDGIELSEDKIREIRARLRGFDSRFVENVERIVVSCMSENIPDMVNARLSYFMASSTLGNGEKILQLSADLCEAFDETSLDVPFRDYSQPFPTMVVQIPANYAGHNNLTEQGVLSESVTTHHDPNEKLLIMHWVNNKRLSVHMWLQYDGVDAIESVLAPERMNASSEADLQVCQRCLHLFRITLNAMLAMTYGKDWKETPLSKSELKARMIFKKQMRKLGSADRAKAQLRLGTLPTYFEFDQKIPAFEDHRTPQGQAIMHGCNAKKPHWRKGHWRQQRTGEGRNESTRVWIKPILINSDRFVGDLKDTKVTFTS